MFIILISGHAGSGKDTLADLFLPMGFKKYAMADAVKTFTSERHGFPFSLTQTQEGKTAIVKSIFTNKEATVRQLLIDDSLEMKQTSCDPAFWARKVGRKLGDDRPEYVVVSDWRYREELNHLNVNFPNAAIITVRIIRNNVIPSKDPSEHDLDDFNFNFLISNNGSVDELNGFVLKIAGKN
jgi:hypothetical protein